MKRLKLNLDQLSEELEMLDSDYLRGIKGGYGDYGGGSGGYGGYNTWEELFDAMQHGYLPPEGTYYPGGEVSYGDNGGTGYGGYTQSGGYGGYSPIGDYGGGSPIGDYGGGSPIGDYGGGYGEYGGYNYSGGPFPRITFNDLWLAYPKNNNGVQQHPSSDSYAINQCAIRLGKALEDAFDIDFTDNSYTKFGPVTSEGWPRGAKSLADYLETNLPGVKKMSYAEWNSSPYKNSEGIIFLKAGAGGTDHIDVYSCGVTGSGMYYADEVWFWPLEDH